MCAAITSTAARSLCSKSSHRCKVSSEATLHQLGLSRRRSVHLWDNWDTPLTRGQVGQRHDLRRPKFCRQKGILKVTDKTPMDPEATRLRRK